jgi:hypothetical protein
VLPALVLGQRLPQAGVESIVLLRHKLRDVMLLRTGYSVLCWVVGLTTYFGSYAFMDRIPREWVEKDWSGVYIPSFYLWVGLPILLGTGVVLVFLRPIYLIAMSTLYVDMLKETGRKIEIPQPPATWLRLAVAGLVLLGIVGVIVFNARNFEWAASMLSSIPGG